MVIRPHSQFCGRNPLLSILQAKLCTLTVYDVDGLQYVQQEMEAKATALFFPDRSAFPYKGHTFLFSLS